MNTDNRTSTKGECRYYEVGTYSTKSKNNVWQVEMVGKQCTENQGCPDYLEALIDWRVGVQIERVSRGRIKVSTANTENECNKCSVKMCGTNTEYR